MLLGILFPFLSNGRPAPTLLQEASGMTGQIAAMIVWHGLGAQQVVSPRTLLRAHQELEKQAMASWGPLPPATAALLKRVSLHPPAPVGIFILRT